MEDIKRKRRKNKPKKGKGIIILIIILLVPFMIQRYYKDSLGAMDLDNPKDIEISIPASTSTMKIASILHEEGLIKNPLVFRHYVKTKGVGNKLRAGDFNLSTGMDMDSIINTITKGSGNQNTTRFTIPEGYEIRQIADKLSGEDIIDRDRFLELVSNKSNFEDEYPFLKELDSGQNLEGFLFPSTYEIFIGSREEEIISKMLRQFEKIYEKDMKSRMKKMDLALNEAVTLASIVEREGKVDEERPLMSAVFHNRIGEGMMLQSCATVQYILGERKERLTNEDTGIPSPYNTYIHQGLPPAPIASPGKSSLIAAVNPADVDYLFFVLTGSDGTHTFTDNYKDHLNAKPKN